MSRLHEIKVINSSCVDNQNDSASTSFVGAIESSRRSMSM